ncbi:MAG: ATP-dependent sacrificial sulfur transferase LarE [Lachnospiraceae bacterium]|nr:ATP-dependent sacrificial sulfur transferase LarE [Lachnospiraceae bacterium]
MTLQDFFGQYKRVAVAFSGGVDSAYLLYAAKRYAKKVCAYYVKSEFQPQFELDDAIKLAGSLCVELKILDYKILSVKGVKENPADRCYYCKKAIFAAIVEAAKADGFSVLLDGTNASDDAGDRPGMRVLQELSVLSPLRDCGLTKSEIRRRSKEAGLFTWDKPAYACLATRISVGETITAEKLAATEAAEDFLTCLGFSDFRVRSFDGNAKLQITQDQWELLAGHRKIILQKLKEYYKTVVLDLEVRG